MIDVCDGLTRRDRSQLARVDQGHSKRLRQADVGEISSREADRNVDVIVGASMIVVVRRDSQLEVRR